MIYLKFKTKLQKTCTDKEFKGIKWKEAEYPLFNYSDPYLRSQVAVCLGCDVRVKGIKGCGPSTLSKVIKEMIEKVGKKEKKLKRNLSTWMVKELSMTKRAIDVFL